MWPSHVCVNFDLEVFYLNVRETGAGSCQAKNCDCQGLTHFNDASFCIDQLSYLFQAWGCLCRF